MKDIRLSHLSLDDDLSLLRDLRKNAISARPEVCIERARYFTQYLKNHSTDDAPRILRFANAVAYFLSKKTPQFFDNNLLPGSTTSKPFGAPIYPEYVPSLAIWPELDSISTRKVNPIYLSEDDADELNFEIFPYWMDRNILEYTRTKYNNPYCMQLFQRLIYFICGKAGCISHTVPDYEVALNKGLEYIIHKAEEKQCSLEKKRDLSSDVQDSILFYRAVQVSLSGIITYAKNLSIEAAELAKIQTDEYRRSNLQILSTICNNVPAKPARSFREAVTSIWLLHVSVLAENINMAISPGRLDQILYKYYKEDVDSGVITDKEVLELIGCLWIKLNDNTNLVPEASDKLFGGAGTVPAVTLGGIDKNGNNAVNELTYIALRATELLRLRDPNVNARYNYKENSKIYRDRVCEVIANTHSVPAFHNDVTDINTLVNQGIELEHARDYAIVGCVELVSAGRDYSASSSIILNLVSALELTLYNGKRPYISDEQIGPPTGDPTDFTNFGEFWGAFRTQLLWLLNHAIQLNEYFGLVHQELQPSPLLSALFEGPMDSGKDLINGGALYNSSGATHVGFADVVDSLSTVEQLVFIEKKYSMNELLIALSDDFVGHEELHARILNKAPKFGSEDEVSSGNSAKLLKLLFDHYQSKINYRGGRYRPAFWTMTNHVGLGTMSGALPNGRKSGKSFSSGITPVSNQVKSLTKCLNSVSNLNHLYIPGGYALNLKFPVVKNGDIHLLAQLIEGYFVNGGMQVQFNILSRELLLDAMINDDPELLVRVSGYSAYFKDLNEEMKKEIITRTEFDIRTGESNEFPEEHNEMLPYK